MISEVILDFDPLKSFALIQILSSAKYFEI